MANLITGTVQDLIKSVMDSFLYTPAQLDDMQKLYFTKVSSVISGITGGEPATVATKLTKDDLIAGITLTEQLEAFLKNTNMVTADNYSTLIRLTNGDTAATGELSPGTEKLGDDLYNLATALLDIHQKCAVIASMYTDNEINDIIANIESTRVVYGATVTVELYGSGITLIEQFSNFVNNSATTTGDYSSTVNQWQSASNGAC